MSLYKKKVLIVNPLSATKYLSDALSKESIYSVALFSNITNVSAFNLPKPEYFDEQIFTEDSDDYLQKIKEI